jgi:hypothetical protein
VTVQDFSGGHVAPVRARVADYGVAFGLILAAALAGAVAADVLVFERSAASIRSGIAEAAGKLEPDRQRALLSQAAPWTDDPVIGGRARSLMIDIAVGVRSPDPKLVEGFVRRLIERKPTFGGNWLSLAQLRQVNGATLSDVLPLVEMSTLLAPHDGHVMVPRVVLAIQNWTTAPESLKTQAIDHILDLAGASGATFQWDLFADVLDDQPLKVRSDVRDRLQQRLPRETRVLQQLGL